MQQAARGPDLRATGSAEWDGLSVTWRARAPLQAVRVSGEHASDREGQSARITQTYEDPDVSAVEAIEFRGQESRKVSVCNKTVKSRSVGAPPVYPSPPPAGKYVKAFGA